MIQNHLFQIVALLAMEPPVGRDYGAVHTEKAKVFEAMRPLTSRDLVRGQYAGYRKEPHVARNSDVETFCAVRLFIDSWRWDGVPWYLRSGKCLPVDRRRSARGAEAAAGASVRRLGADRRAGKLPALPALARRSGRAGRPRQAVPARNSSATSGNSSWARNWPAPKPPYDRLLSDAMIGDGALFTREDAVEAAWAAVDPVLARHPRALPYRKGTWGPRQAESLIAAPGGWHNPSRDGVTR